MYHSMNAKYWTFRQVIGILQNKPSGNVFVEKLPDGRITVSYDLPMYTSKQITNHDFVRLLPQLRKIGKNQYVYK